MRNELLAGTGLICGEPAEEVSEPIVAAETIDANDAVKRSNEVPNKDRFSMKLWLSHRESNKTVVLNRCYSSTELPYAAKHITT